MMSVDELDPAQFLRRVNDSIELRLFLNVFSSADLPSARRIEAFLEEKLPPVIEFIVLWLNLNLLEDGDLEIGNQFGTDGMEMSAQARMKSDAAGLHLVPFLSWLLLKVRGFLETQERAGLTPGEREELLAALRSLDWSELGNAAKNKSAILEAILLANTLKWHKVKAGDLTPMKIKPPKRQTVPTQAAG